MTAEACTQPGCGGTIQDGYCDVCGLAPAVTAAPVPPAGWAQPPDGGSIRYAGRAAAGGAVIAGPAWAAVAPAAPARAAPGPAVPGSPAPGR